MDEVSQIVEDVKDLLISGVDTKRLTTNPKFAEAWKKKKAQVTERIGLLSEEDFNKLDEQLKDWPAKWFLKEIGVKN